MSPERPLNRVFVTLGSNIEPERHLPWAVRELRRIGNVLAVSRVWQTHAVGDPDQADFLNAAVLLETSLDARTLKLDVLASIEQRLGRVRDPRNKNAARTIDLDIALFNDETLMIEHRCVPDPDILTRPFVAGPLAELDPEYIHPVTGESLSTIAARVALNADAMFLRPDVSLDNGIQDPPG